MNFIDLTLDLQMALSLITIITVTYFYLVG
jgi:hypothetical protein